MRHAVHNTSHQTTTLTFSISVMSLNGSQSTTMHDYDPEKSLAGLRSIGSVRDELQSLKDDDVTRSLVSVPAARDDDPDRTAHWSRRAHTSDGGRLRILRPYARGSFDEVFVAFDCELDREGALKQLDVAHHDVPTIRRRFVEEARITASLEHPGIVPVYGIGVDEHNHPHYVMRPVAGRTLGDAIDEFHPGGHDALSCDRLLRRLIDVCYTVAHGRSRNVLHRALKPSNVLVGEFRQTFVIDWGLAKRTTDVDTTESHHVETLASMLTHEGSPGGTPAYMSPEQAAGRLTEIDERSDIYCLGATLYR